MPVLPPGLSQGLRWQLTPEFQTCMQGRPHPVQAMHDLRANSSSIARLFLQSVLSAVKPCCSCSQPIACELLRCSLPAVLLHLCLDTSYLIKNTRLEKPTPTVCHSSNPVSIAACTVSVPKCLPSNLLLLSPGVLSRPEAAALLASIPSASRSDVLAQLDPLTIHSTASELRSMGTM